MGDAPDTSAPLEGAKQQRRSLRMAMADLEAALAGPASADTTAWGRSVEQATEGVRTAFARHVAVTEGPDGLFAEVTERAPRLAARVRKLCDEHVQLGGECDRLLQRLTALGDGDGVTEVRDAGVTLLAGIVRHRHGGADLVYDAYNVDIDAAD